MSIKYLSPSGLTEVWSNIKTYIASKIPSKIITGLSIKGRTITYTNSDGTTGTLTTQDTDTTYTSMSATEATTGTATTARSISAKVLHDKITSITNTKAKDADVVHKSGAETIAGTKTFKNNIVSDVGGAAVIRVEGGSQFFLFKKDHATLPGGVILRSFKADDTYIDFKILNNGSITWNNKNVLTESNGVTLNGNQTINGLKTFDAWQIINYGLNVKWITGNKEQKSLHLFGSMDDKYQGFGSELKLYGDDANYGKFILVARDKTNTNVKIFVGLPNGTLTWDGKTVLTAGNGMTVDTNQTITGAKTFSNVTYSNKDLIYQDTKYDWTNTSLDTWCDAGHVSWFDKTGNRRMHELVGTNGGVWQKACYINENPYFAVNSNRHITYWGNTIAFNGTTTFTGNVICNGISHLKMTNLESNTTTPTSAQYSNIRVVANNGSQVGAIQFCKRADGSFDTTIYSSGGGSNDTNDGTLRITSKNEVYPINNNKTKLGISTAKWSEVWASTFNGNSVICTDYSAFMAQRGGYTFLIRNDGSNTYFLMSDKDGTPGTWSTARPLTINNATGICNINGNANTATSATQDSAGQRINTTYIKGVSFSGRTFTFTRGNDTTFAITIHDNVVINTLANSFGSTGVGGICFVSGRTKNNIGGFGADVAGSDIHLVHSLGFDVSTTGTGSNVIIENDYDSSLYGTWRLLGSVSLGPVNHGNGNAYAYKRWTLAIRIA